MPLCVYLPPLPATKAEVSICNQDYYWFVKPKV